MIGRYIRSFFILLLCFLSAFVILIFSWLPKGGVYPFISRKVWGPGLLWLAGAKLKVSGLENIPKDRKGIFYSNHQSHYDIPAITAALPIPVYFIAKKELKKIPIFGWGMWACGMVFVDRQNREKAKKSMKLAARKIELGKSVLTFPEGTRSRDGQLGIFKKGTFHLAKNGPLKLIPIAVSGSRNVLPRDGKLTPGQYVEVKVGKPISPETVGDMDIRELSQLSKERLEKLLQSDEANTDKIENTLNSQKT
jgi:1-acyl-sn-glycerol-3-phosphate acyltransferase